MKKKIRCILILAFLFALTVGSLAFAEDGWDGFVDTSWYEAGKKTLHIADEADLAGLAAIVNGTAAVQDDFCGKNGLRIDDIQLIYDLYTNYADYCGDKNFDIADIAVRFRADYNGDGVVDMQDMQAVMNLFLNS